MEHIMPDVLDMKTGQAIFLKALAHEAENIGKTDFTSLSC